VNEKSQVTNKKLYSKDRKRERASGIKKKVTDRKATQRKTGNSPQLQSYLLGQGEGEGRDQNHNNNVSQANLATADWQTWPQDKPTLPSSPEPNAGIGCDSHSTYMAGQHWRINTFCHSLYLGVL
jgi:hypothetical protein